MSTEYLIYVKGDDKVKISKEKNETQLIYLERVFFILNNINKKINYDKLIKYSKIYVNIKYSKCIYSKEVIDELNTISS